jgi:hypothetical protein
MFGSTVLEVAIGMTFCYGFVGLLVSTLQEALAAALHLRARTLLKGIKTMLNDPAFAGLARDLYAHALVNPRDDGNATDPHELVHKPSYIDPRHFAVALVDTIQTIPGNFEQLGRDIDGLSDPQVRVALQGMYVRAHGSVAVFQEHAAHWFDNAMERVSGSYKRKSLVASLLISLAIAILFNIDSVHLFQTLWTQPALAAALKAVPTAVDADSLASLRALPVGWQGYPPFDASLGVRVAGWLLTAASSLFGAPFWFDLFQRLIHLRGTGDKPAART